MDDSMDKPTTVTTIHGNRYCLTRELGRGGQGTVYAVEGDRFAVKIVHDRSDRARDRLRDQLAMVSRLPLEDLAVARPIEQLRPPHVGYVMELFTGMVPLRDLLRPSSSTSVPKISPAHWYLATGGLRRRLRLLARLAELFAELHGRGLIFVDPSPHNVFVSADASQLEVRLIDMDNVRSSSAVGCTLYTPGYGAPEFVRETGLANTLSDAHAFAVMAFETLTLVHPLIGDLVRDGEPELEELAFAGKLAWIDHEHDATNRSSDGIPRAVVLSRTLLDNFRSAFEGGLDRPTDRPGLARWVEHLDRAADRTVSCPSCRGSYYYDRARCPWCGVARPAFVVAVALIWDPQRLRNAGSGTLELEAGILREPDGKLRVVDAVAISMHESVWLTERVTGGTRSSTPRLRVEVTGERLRLEARASDESWRLVSADAKQARAFADQPIELALRGGSSGWLVHTGPNDRLHRVIRFDLRPEANP